MEKYNFNAMKTRNILIAISAFAAALACSGAQKTEDLFNGKNLDGWKFFVENGAAKPEDVFSVKNGMIHIKGVPFGFMYTENKYSNFRLHVEWKYPIGGSNSGIFLFLQEPAKELWPNAVECQLCSGKAGDFVLLGGSDVAEYKAPEGKPRPKFPVVERFEKDRENPVGEWNSADIVCRGGNIEVYINGTLQNVGTKSAHSSGYIGLQSEGGDILFRNVRLTPMD